MSLRKQFATDQKKELEGVRVEYAPNKDGSIPTFIIARQCRNNVKWLKIYEQETRPYQRLIDSKRIDPQLATEINMRVFVKALLLDWEHIQPEDDGKEIPLNFDNAISLLRELPDLFTDLNTQTQEANLFREETIEAETKN
jgi:hypothetical protein